jgi:hypothetical protein
MTVVAGLQTRVFPYRLLALPCLLVYKSKISPFPRRAFLLTFINFHS